MRTVVVGIDGSQASTAALDLAAEEAAAHLAPLVIVYVHPTGTPRRPDEDALLDIAVFRALANHPGLSISTRLLEGEPCRELMAQSHDAELLVLGHRCAGALAPYTGSLDVRTADGSECPVIVHRPFGSRYTATGPRPVLVGVDGRPGSEAAVEFAFEEAALRGAPVLGMHVWSGADPGAAGNGGTGSDRAARVLDEALGAWSAEYPEVPTVRQVAAGADVVRALATASAAAQLTVIGSGGHHDPTRAANRWTARAVVDRAGCPVAVVPTPV